MLYHLTLEIADSIAHNALYRHRNGTLPAEHFRIHCMYKPANFAPCKLTHSFTGYLRELGSAGTGTLSVEV